MDAGDVGPDPRNFNTVLERLTKPFFDEAEGYDGGGEVMEGLKDVDATFIAHGDAPEAGEPCQGSLDFPAVSAEALAVIDAAPRDAGDDGAAAQGVSAPGEVIALVAME